MQTICKNGKIFKNACRLIYGTGKGLGMAAGTGYKAGYFMAKHPKIELARTQLQKNIKPYVLAVTGIVLGITAFLMMKKS